MSPTHTAVREILAAIRGRAVHTIDAETRLADLSLDSLDRLVLAVRLEERYGRPLSDEALIAAATVGDLDRLVEPAARPA